MKIKVVKIVCFVLIFIFILSGIIRILLLKGDQLMYGVKSFFKDNSNRYTDVLFVGSSHVHYGIDTTVLYKNYGIASYNLASSLATFWSMYFYIKETIQYQKPSLLIVDVFTINRDDESIVSDNIIDRFSLGVPLSFNKVNAIMLEGKKNMLHNYINPLYLFHNRYDGLNYADFLRYKGRDRYKYYKLNLIRYNIPKSVYEPNIKNIKERIKLYSKSEDYYLKIIKLSIENNIPILFIVIPYSLNEKDQKMFNEAERIAEEYNVPFINFNLDYDDYNLNFSEDFYDGGHLNYKGAAKFTRYLGKYLKENYDLPDRRGDPKYYSWEMNAKYHDKDIYNIELKQYTNLNEYMEKVKNADDYVIGITMLGNYQKNDRVVQSIATNFNINNIYLKNASYVVDNNKLIYSSDGSNQYLFHKEIGSYTDLVVQNGQRLSINRKNYIKTKNGINIVIYDKFTEEIVDNIYLEYKEKTINPTIKR